MVKSRFETLDVFRGLAAIMVAIFHFARSGGSLDQYAFINNGHRWVNFFFVLSGFIIYHNYKNILQKQQRNQFFLKRLFRLYPLHLTILLLFLFLEIFKAILFQYGFFNHPAFDRNSVIKLFQNLFMLQGIAKTSDGFSWNYPSWSISCEIFAYTLFGFVIILLNNSFKSYKKVCLLTISIIALIIKLNTNTYFEYVLDCILCFFFGCFIEDIFQMTSRFKKTKLLYSLLEILLLSIAIAGVCYLDKKVSILLTPVYGALIWVFASETGIVSRLLTNKLTIWLGSLSYSIYMTHAIVLAVIEVVLSNILKVSPYVFNFAVIPFLILVLTMSAITFKFIEKKGQIYLGAVFKNWGNKVQLENRIAVEDEN